MCVSMCVHVCMWAYACACMHMCAGMCMSACISACKFTCMSVYPHSYGVLYMSMCMCACICLCVHVSACLHAYGCFSACVYMAKSHSTSVQLGWNGAIWRQADLPVPVPGALGPKPCMGIWSGTGGVLRGRPMTIVGGFGLFQVRKIPPMVGWDMR